MLKYLRHHQSQRLLHVVKKRRRHFLLLEVLIAFAIVAIAILPLIYPHYYIYEKQKTFIHKINLDITVNRLYGDILVKLHKNEISWTDIESNRVFLLNDILGPIEAMPFKGTGQFKIIKKKKNDEYGLFLVRLSLVFTPNSVSKYSLKSEGPITYTYDLFVSRIFQLAANSPPVQGDTP